MEYFPSKIAIIEEKARGQSKNPLWFAVRKHMITASIAHEIKTRIETYNEKGGLEVDMTTGFSKISGKTSFYKELPALKYGRAMEKEAVRPFMLHFEESHHNVRFKELVPSFAETCHFFGEVQTSLFHVAVVVSPVWK